MSQAPTRPQLSRSLDVFRVRGFRDLFWVSLVSNAAMSIQMIARPFLAYELSGSFGATGFVSISFALPMLALSLPAGAAADRIDKRVIMLVTQIGTLGAALLTGVLISADLMSIPVLFAIGLLEGTSMAFRMPAQMAMLPNVVEEERLGGAMAITNAGASLTRPAAPIVTGLLIAATGIGSVYYAQVLLYVVTLSFVWRLPATTRSLDAPTPRSLRTEVGAGFSYLFGDQRLVSLLILALVPMALLMPAQSTLLTPFAVGELDLDPGALGGLLAVGALGATIGSILVATLAEHPRKATLQLAFGVASGFGIIALAIGSRSLGLGGAVVGLAALSLFQSAYMTLNMTMIMTGARQEYLGRVMSIFMLLFSAIPLASWPMGIAADQISASAVFGWSGVLVLAFFALNVGRIRRLGALDPASSVVAEDASAD